MIRYIDDTLIDRVFQPVADRCAQHASCYALAAFLLTGCGLAALASAVVADGTLYRCLNLIIVPCIAVVLVRANYLDRAPPSDVMPIERIQYVNWRTANLFIAILDLESVVGTPTLRIALNAAMWLLLTAAMFFMACRRLPPAARRARARWWRRQTATAVG